MAEFIPAKKSLGQHFLNDVRIADKIASLVEPHVDELILEIGPGTGVLTRPLCTQYRNTILAVEADPRAVEVLQPLSQSANLKIILCDILSFDLPKENFVAVGNLPYYISSPILFYFLNHKAQFRKGVFMLQLEVARRIAAPPGNKEYGILSILLGRHYVCKLAFKVSAGAFRPPPKVESAILTLERRTAVTELDESLFRNIVKTAFNQRRKMLSNSLKSLKILINPEYLNLRPEQLSIQQFEELTILNQT